MYENGHDPDTDQLYEKAEALVKEGWSREEKDIFPTRYAGAWKRINLV